MIKHDGHEFEADIGNRYLESSGEAGACGTLVFSGTKYMMVKYHPAESTEELISLFPEADIILLEGFKHSEYPKIEVIRKANSLCSVCDPRFLQGIVTDISREELKYDAGEEVEEIPFLSLMKQNLLRSGSVSYGRKNRVVYDIQKTGVIKTRNE